MKTRKKMLAVIMSVAMILTMVPIALFANADEGLDEFNGDTSGTYAISTADDLMLLASNVNDEGNTYEGCTFTLTNDISLSGKTWKPIGFGSHTKTISEGNTKKVANVFKGSFNGNGKSISDITYNDAVTTTDPDTHEEKTTYTGGNIGVFGSVSGASTIENLIVKDSTFVIKGLVVKAGAIAGQTDTEVTVKNCLSYNTEINLDLSDETYNANYIGGLVGESNGAISNSYSRANLYLNAPMGINFLGGIAGTNGGSITSTYFAGRAIVGSSLIGAVGGISGQNSGTVEKSYNTGIINGPISGGVVGYDVSTKANDNTTGVSGTTCFYHEDSSTQGATRFENGTFTTPTYDAKTFSSTTTTTGNSVSVADMLVALGDKFVAGDATYPYPTLTGNYLPAAAEPSTKLPYTAGNGTLYNPYQITTAKQLDAVRNDLSAAYILQDNVTIHDYEYNNAETNLSKIKDKLAGDSILTDLGTTSISDILGNSTLLNSLKSKLGNDGILDSEGGAFSAKASFDPIGSGDTIKPFVGIFDGNDKTISNLKIAVTDSNYAAMFANNKGTIKDFTINSVDSTDGATADQLKDYSLFATIPSFVSLTQTGVAESTDYSIRYAAGVVAINNGIVSNVKSSADVTATTNNYKAYAAGIVADNKLAVNACENTGLIFTNLTSESLTASETVDFANVMTKINLKAAGVVALNEGNGFVKDCKSLKTARNIFTSAETTTNIAEGQYVAKNTADASAVSGSSDLGLTVSKQYLNFNLPYCLPSSGFDAETTLTHADNQGLEAKLAEAGSNKAYVLNNATPGKTPDVSVTYGEKNENYQKVTVNYTDKGADDAVTTDDIVHTTSFFVWFKLDPTTINVEVPTPQPEFLKGEGFNSRGLRVTAGTGSDAVTLNEVTTATDNGYMVKVYSDEACANQVTSLAAANAGTYYVQVTYGDTVLTPTGVPAGQKYAYTIKVCDITEIALTSAYDSYLEGQEPALTAKAVYNDRNSTTRALTDFDYYICDSEAAVATATDAEKNINVPTVTESGAKKYIAVKYTNQSGATLTSNIKEISVVKATETVDTLSATTSKTDANVNYDNVKLTWLDDYASSYVVYRSSDGADYKKLSTTTDHFYLDTTAVAGTTYKYKVVMLVAGEACTNGAEITDVESPMPDSITVDHSAATKYFTLGSSYSTSGLKVTAKFSHEPDKVLSYSSDNVSTDNATTKYKIDTDYDANQPGTYNATVMYDGKRVNEYNNPATNTDTYTVTVLAPNGISATAGYDCYPTGYSAENFKKTITLKEVYKYPDYGINTTSRVTATTAATTLPDYSSAVTPAGETATVKVSYTPSYTGATALRTTITDIRFVPSAPPTGLTSVSNDVGYNIITWGDTDTNATTDKLTDGADSYNVYRAEVPDGTDPATVADDQYVKIGRSDPSKTATKADYSDRTALPGKKYAYKVKAVIATEESTFSLPTAVTTRQPTYIVADSEKAKKDFALGSDFTYTGLKVTAYYLKDGQTDDYTQLSDKTKYATRDLSVTKDGSTFGYTYDASTFKGDTAGTYTITIKHNGDANYNEKAIGAYDVTVYPVKGLSVVPRNTHYAYDSTFVTTNELTVSVEYGNAEKTVGSTTTTNYTVMNEPNMRKYGVQSIVVADKTNPDMTAACSITVYDSKATTVIGAELDTNGKIVIGFTDVQYASAYAVYRATSTDMKDKKLISTVADEASKSAYYYTDTSAKAGTTYSYYVVPKFGSNLGEKPSNIATATAIKATIEAKSTSGYTKTSGYITGIQPSTSYAKLKNNLVSGESIRVFKGSTEITSGNIGTGYVAKLYVDGSTSPVAEATLVVLGDTNGDATINVQDVKKTLNQSLGKTTLGAVYKLAADVNKDGTVNVQDVKKVLNVSLGKKTSF